MTRDAALERSLRDNEDLWLACVISLSEFRRRQRALWLSMCTCHWHDKRSRRPCLHCYAKGSRVRRKRRAA